jgi:hypothetical protein
LEELTLMVLTAVGKGLSGWHLEKEVDVVFHSADGVYEDLFLFADAGGICPEAFFHCGGNQFLAFFGAEYDVDDVLNVCVRQSIVASGAGF